MSAVEGARLRRSTVARRHWVTPRMIRLTLTGDLDDFVDGGTDQHVAFYFYPAEAIVPAQIDPDRMRALHEFAMPQVRRYTVRRFDPVTREIDFDVVVHEPAGLAAAWARDARVGDPLLWWGPTPAWPLPAETDTVVMIGDETALPAIDATLAGLPAGVSATVIAEVAERADETYLAHHRERADITWVHRGEPDGNVCEELMDAVRSTDALPQRTAIWAGVEFQTAGALRRWFIGERGFGKDRAFVVSYWIHGQAQDMRADARARERTRRARAADPQRARTHVRAVGSQLPDQLPK